MIGATQKIFSFKKKMFSRIEKMFWTIQIIFSTIWKTFRAGQKVISVPPTTLSVKLCLACLYRLPAIPRPTDSGELSCLDHRIQISEEG
jgi:hypothetical protein